MKMDKISSKKPFQQFKNTSNGKSPWVLIWPIFDNIEKCALRLLLMIIEFSKKSMQEETV